MKLKEYIKSLSRGELEKELFETYKYAGLDTEADLVSTDAPCTGHDGECGKWGANCVWIPCSNPPR